MSHCSRCGAPFSCAMADRADPGRAAGAPDEPCWCGALPAVAALPRGPAGACWCPACLKEHIAQAQSAAAQSAAK